MKKWLLILGCSLALCGCTESTIVERGGELSPDFETRAGIELDWQQAFDEMEDIYVGDEEVLSLAYFLNEEEDGSETIYITAIVAPGMLRSDAAYLGTRMVKSLNDCMADQDFSFEKSGDNTYGGFIAEYNICVRVIAENAAEDPEKALVNDTIMIGDVYRAISPNK